MLSLALHLIAVSGSWLRVPPPVAPPPVLEARLESAPRVTAPPAPAALPKPAPKPAVRERVRPRALVLPPAAAPAPFTLPAEPEPVPSAEEGPDAPSAPEAPQPDQLARIPDDPPPQPPPARMLPGKGRITYAVHIGGDGYSVGRTVQSWEVEGRSYRLGSFSETTGLIDIFRSQRLVYLSRGTIGVRGLEPEHFLMSRTRRGRTEEARAHLDRETKTITFGRHGGQQTAVLAEDAQDIVSFMYQLSLAPPAPGRIVLPITNGYRYEAYEIDVMPEEMIETPLGPMKALPLYQVRRPGAESLAVWLGVDYRHLPVRIRFFDREGNHSGEQVVSDISIGRQ